VPSRHPEAAEVLEDPLVRELLGARLIGVLATFDDERIHAVPMWFAGAGDVVYLATGSRSRKVRNLGRDARATLVVHDSRPGFEVCGASSADVG
jgi:nitroimidazol reductase NimA-like FMN-containing flavoprotein (pyridoxamine 5'-phosphate oxidase superfamily)